MNSYVDGTIAPLTPGAVAPNFTLPHTPQARLALSGLHGQPVVLVFYPMDWEPVSAEQLALYQDYSGAFDRFGAHLLGLSIDHAHSHVAFAHATQVRFPLLADFQPRGAVARMYGVYREEEGVSARAVFVLDRQRVIRFSQAFPDLLNPGVDDLLTTLEALAAHNTPAPARRCARRPGSHPRTIQDTRGHTRTHEDIRGYTRTHELTRRNRRP